MRYGKLLEGLGQKVDNNVSYRRYSLPELISESYKAQYNCDGGSNLQKIAEAQIKDIRLNPKDTERLSRQLCQFKHLIKMVESGKVKDEELLVSEEDYDTVEPKEKKVEEAKEEEEVEKVDEAHGPEEEEDILEDTELTDEEVEELSKHLEEIRKNKKVNECDDTSAPEEEKKVVREGRKLKKKVVESEEGLYQPTPEEATAIVSRIKRKYGNEISEEDYIKLLTSMLGEDEVSTDVIDMAVEKAGITIKSMYESLSWDKISLTEFSKKSAGKAFMKTFKKMDAQLREGNALTRQESINLYKAANSAMTHLSVELEHNPEFLPVFKESMSLLSADVAKLLESMKNGKAPSKATMKSLAKFSEALLLKEAEEDEELPPIEDEDDEIIDPEGTTYSEEEEQFDQEYAEARMEIHKEIAEEHGDSEDPAIQDKIEQDAEEIADLPGVTEEQLAELGEEGEGDPGDSEEEVEESKKEEEEIEEKKVEMDISDDITDEELEVLKKHLKEMREAKKAEKK